MGDHIAVLYSGGIESSLLAEEKTTENNKVDLIYIKTGLNWETVELQYAQRLAKRWEVNNLAVLHSTINDVYNEKEIKEDLKPEHYVPGRNITLFSKAALYCGKNNIQNIYHGTLRQSDFPDDTLEFTKDMEKVLSRGLDKDINIKVPYAGRKKREIIREADRKLPIEKTFSCVSPENGKHCGKCIKCESRKQNFNNAGVEDKTKYSLD